MSSEVEIRKYFEQRLLDLAKAQSDLHSESENMKESEISSYDQHPADQGTETHEQELDLTRHLLLEEEKRKVKEAQEALENGTYGICTECKQEIAPGRLEAIPESIRCVDCQRHIEGERVIGSAPSADDPPTSYS